MSTAHFSLPARLLHWLVALLVLATIPVGLTMAGNDVSRSLRDTLYLFHKNTGVLILLLVACRLAYRIAHPAPPLPTSMPAWQAAAARRCRPAPSAGAAGWRRARPRPRCGHRQAAPISTQRR